MPLPEKADYIYIYIPLFSKRKKNISSWVYKIFLHHFGIACFPLLFVLYAFAADLFSPLLCENPTSNLCNLQFLISLVPSITWTFSSLHMHM
ncbi:hypothetical protein RJT34_28084 [Clitoria ternatea]|uniref:Uncharacterized protein n=1 Tax=Clitoria ternatea TaxID=43366 RepID=A0AAN9FH73_CLITE